MLTAIAYNKTELKHNATKNDIKIGYNLWVDLVNATESELTKVSQDFQLDESALEEYRNKSKKPQVRILDEQKFAIALDIKFQDSSALVTESIYLFGGRGWLVTLHSDRVNLRTRIMALIKQKNIGLTGSSIDVLFYTILANLVQSYEQLLTAIELTVSELGQRTLSRPTRKMLEYLDSLSRQVIVLRRHFWQMRDLISYIKHIEEDKQDIKYLNVVYDDINQLIEMVESYSDTINSTRELYIASVSLQMSDAMKTLTIFSAILLPLTFVASIYGMNGLDLERVFEVPSGIVIVAAFMASMIGVLLFYFKRKRWILSQSYKERIDKRGEDEARTSKVRPLSQPRKTRSVSARPSDSSRLPEKDRYSEQSLDQD